MQEIFVKAVLANLFKTEAEPHF